jgi:hypothetical protein
MFFVDALAVLAIRLSEPPIVIVSLNLLDARASLTLHVLLNVFL